MALAQTTERAFESYVEEILREKAGWQPEDKSEWDFYCSPEQQRRPITPRCRSNSSLQSTASMRFGTKSSVASSAKKLNGYVRVYAFMSQIVPYADPDMEMLYSYGRFLVPHLPIERDPAIKLTDEVGLQYYRLERISSGALNLDEGEPVGEFRVSDSRARDSDVDQTFRGPSGGESNACARCELASRRS
jgi:hypothetical protein